MIYKHLVGMEVTVVNESMSRDRRKEGAHLRKRSPFKEKEPMKEHERSAQRDREFFVLGAPESESRDRE